MSGVNYRITDPTAFTRKFLLIISWEKLNGTDDFIGRNFENTTLQCGAQYTETETRILIREDENNENR